MIEPCGWCARLHESGPEHCLSGPIIVCGGRDYWDRDRAFVVLDKVAARVEILSVRHGACGLDADEPFNPAYLKGADRWAHEWAMARGYPVHPYVAAWRRQGGMAGPQRNQRQIDDWDPAVPSSRPCCLIAFPGGSGTADMIRRAHAAGLKLWVVDFPRRGGGYSASGEGKCGDGG
jgi:hypothetical protein